MTVRVVAVSTARGRFAELINPTRASVQMGLDMVRRSPVHLFVLWQLAVASAWSSPSTPHRAPGSAPRRVTVRRALSPTAAVTSKPSVAAAAAAVQSLAFAPLGTPANYTEVLSSTPSDAYSVIKWQAPYCRSCKEPSPTLDRLRDELGPEASYYSMDLIRDGKAAGKRMAKFFKERNVTVMPYIEVYRGSVCIEAGPDRELASQPCVFTPTSISCQEGEYSAVMKLMDRSKPAA